MTWGARNENGYRYSLVGRFLFYFYFEKETAALEMKVFVELKFTINIMYN